MQSSLIAYCADHIDVHFLGLNSYHRGMSFWCVSTGIVCHVLDSSLVSPENLRIFGLCFRGLILTTSPMLQMSVGVFVVLLTGWWILALGIIRIVHAFHLLKIKRESPDFVFGEMIGSNWWVALILGLLLGVLGVIVILNPLLGLGVIGVVVGCGMITAGINLIFLSTSVWLL